MEFKNLISNKGSKLEGPLEIIPSVFPDKRGLFFESWNQSRFDNCVGKNIIFVQDNQSKSIKNVLRGLHFQSQPKAQDKLVRVVKGAIYDVIVDLRKNKSTFGLWSGIEINDELNNQLWVPKGFAHGFITISDYAIVQYKTSNYWSKEHEKCLLWNDIRIKIDWQIKKYNLSMPIISEKDLLGNTLEKLIERGDIFL